MDFHVSALGHTLAVDFFPNSERRDTQPDYTPPLLAFAAALIPVLLRSGFSKEPASAEADLLQSWGFWLKKLGETPNPADFPEPPPIRGLPANVRPFASAIYLLWEQLEAQPKARQNYASILVNGKPRTWFGDTATYRGILMQTSIVEGRPGEEPRITYTNGLDGAEGSLMPDEEVEIVSDMVFSVVAR